ncbi:MAG TPA: alpha/beta hydrolase [Gemmatimonadaceae bacterium]|nr:alpha/beta hydrolase [Gemmatimonadaceae bacterium]
MTRYRHRVRTLAWLLTVVSVGVGCTRAPTPDTAPAAPAVLMTPGELVPTPYPAPDHRLAYGPDSSQVGELRVPRGRGPHPVVVLVHGGCFKAAYATLRDLAALGAALTADGIATWNVEYRRLGQPGGGWPGTYLDVGRAVDHLRTIARQHDLDLGRVVVVGHSAGGHLALWTGARGRLPADSPLRVADPLLPRGVVDLAGPIDMTANIDGYQTLCRDSVITSLLGGTPATVPDRYAQASAIRMLPLGVPQVIVVGSHEEFVPLPLVRTYETAARRAGDSVRVVLIEGAGHFEIASPRAFTWPRVRSAIRALLEGRLPPG